MELGYSPGFRINTVKYRNVRWATEANGKFIQTFNAKTKTHVESTYPTGYVFGAFLAVGTTNLVPKKGGMTVFFVETRDPDPLIQALKEAFLVEPRHFKRLENQYTVVVHSVALARILDEFGKGNEKELPEKYLVRNQKFLHGVRDGILYFDGHTEDTRDLPKRRKFNPRTLELLELINTHYP